MTPEELFNICRRNGRRPAIAECRGSAVIAVCGMEGRLFYIHAGKVISLFRPEAAENTSSSRRGYFNPGGDGLWPAPEGTCLGYEYPTGKWRVPAGIVGAQYEVTEQNAATLVITAEIDLVNDRQLGLPCRFTRRVEVAEEPGGTTVIEQHDEIEYLGSRPLAKGEFMLAPWSLSQFAVGPTARACFGDPGTRVRDLYQPSGDLLTHDGNTIVMRPDDARRIQAALPEESRFVRLRLPEKGIEITRTSPPLAPGLTWADIADAAPDRDPAGEVRYSIYNDPSGFMELEVVGGCPETLVAGTILGVDIVNRITKFMED